MSPTNSITIKNKRFVPYINTNEINDIIIKTASDISNYYKNIINADNPLIIVGVLNGAFMFLSDLVKHLDFPCEIHFIKVSSYIGTETSGTITNIIGLNTDIHNKHVLIIEDLIDTGITINNLIENLSSYLPTKINICTLFFKEENYNGKNIDIRFIGKKILNKFIVGYGLDHDNFGRNLNSIYILDS